MTAKTSKKNPAAAIPNKNSASKAKNLVKKAKDVKVKTGSLAKTTTVSPQDNDAPQTLVPRGKTLPANFYAKKVSTNQHIIQVSFL